MPQPLAVLARDDTDHDQTSVPLPQDLIHDNEAVLSDMWAIAFAFVEGRKASLLATGQVADDVSSSVQMSIAANDWYRLHRLLEIII